MRRGTSLIDLIMSLGILALLFSGIYLVFFSVLDAIVNVELRASASSVLNQEIETIRNLPYGSVGTVGGIPAGLIPPQRSVTYGTRTFFLATTVRNIDDPFDGTLGGSPNDTAPADYKLVSLEISCPTCHRFVPLFFTTTVSPKNLESASSDGSLFINVFNADGVGVSGASVRIVNASVTPSIDLTDVTNASGVLQLVGVPTSTQSYSIDISKENYSRDRTYPLGAPGNPNPLTPHATVAAGSVTNVSFAIARTSRLTIRTSDYLCAPPPNMNFSITGAKLIGTPDVLKFSTTSATGATGTKAFSALEWDTYSMVLNEAAYDVAGTIPFVPLTINPSSTVDFRFVLQSANADALLLSVKDAASGAAVSNATVTVSRVGFSATARTGEANVADTNWAGGAYSIQDGGIDANSVPGSLRLAANASGTYSLATSWLISNTFDLGGSSSTFSRFRWAGSVPPSSGANAVLFQLAGNNDNATWNFTGPDGSGSTYYSAAESAVFAGLDNSRYVRYKAYLSTLDETVTPQVDSVAIDFGGNCVPPGQAIFSGLSAATYDIQVEASGYQMATSTAAVAGAFQSVQIFLSP